MYTEMLDDMTQLQEHIADSPSPESSFLLSEGGPFAVEHEDNMLRLSGVAKYLHDIRSKFTTTRKTSVIAGALTFMILCITTVTSFTAHVPGSYVRFRTLAQQDSLQPDFIDPDGGPLELAGSRRCGSHPTEAQALGCVFDLMNFGWTAPECYYDDVSSAHFRKGPWKWYLDTNLTVEIPQDYAALGRVVEVFTTRGYHVEHCKWADEIIGLAKGNDDVLIPHVLAHEDHMLHCPAFVEESEGKPFEEVVTWTRLVYSSCMKTSQANLTIVS